MGEDPAGGITCAFPAEAVNVGLNKDPTAPHANNPVDVKTTAWSMVPPKDVPPIPAL